MRLVRPGRSAVWTKDRIEALTTAEVRQLRDNAERLSETEIVGLCDEVIKARPKNAAAKTAGAPVKGAAKTKRTAAA
jgi:hypothetical protein